MTRMSREFSLVLLGAGILTAGYFVAPSREEELEQKANEQAARQVGHHNYHHRTGVPLLLFVHSRGYAGSSARSPAMPNTHRGGFGGTGRALGAGGS
jgi:hypothetical protein